MVSTRRITCLDTAFFVRVNYFRFARHSVIDAPDRGNGTRGGDVHIYCYRLLASLGQVHAYQTTSSDNIISIKPYMV